MSAHDRAFPTAGKGNLYSDAPESFTIAGPGHPYHDPTSPTVAPAWLVASLEEHGQIDPISVVVEGDVRYVLRGRSRVLAACAINKNRRRKKLPEMVLRYVLVDKRTTTEEQRQRSIDAENVDRRHLTPIAIAQYVAADAAKGYPASYTAQRLAAAGVVVDDLPAYAAINAVAPETREAIRDGRIPWRAAQAWEGLSREEQAQRLAALPVGPVSLRRAKEAAKKERGARAEVLRLPSLPTFAAMRAVVGGSSAPVRDLLDALAGEWGPLEKSAPDLAAAMQAARAKASKPGRKAP